MSQVNTSVDEEVKKEATAILCALGLTMTQAVNMMLRQVIYTHSLPFEVSLPSEPSSETLESINEIEGGETTRVDTVDEMFKSSGIN